MSRLEEVEADLAILSAAGVPDLARTLAADVDARDEVIAELLAMLKPGEEPKPEAYDGYDQLFRERLCRWNDQTKLHARAVAIAEGRTETTTTKKDPEQ